MCSALGGVGPRQGTSPNETPEGTAAFLPKPESQVSEGISSVQIDDP